MKKMTVTINGVEYPCYETMGAMLRFKQETGKEVSEVDISQFSFFCIYLWCCVASACAREKKEFGYSVMDFADNITPETMTAWTDMLREVNGVESADDAQKKVCRNNRAVRSGRRSDPDEP